MKISNEKPPRNARRVYRWADLPECRAPSKYLVETDGREPREIVVTRKRQKVLEGLMRSPLYAASYARIGDHVSHLKHDLGVDIETLMFRDDPETGRETYGVYRLTSRVTRIDQSVKEVAA